MTVAQVGEILGLKPTAAMEKCMEMHPINVGTEKHKVLRIWEKELQLWLQRREVQEQADEVTAARTRKKRPAARPSAYADEYGRCLRMDANGNLVPMKKPPRQLAR